MVGYREYRRGRGSYSRSRSRSRTRSRSRKRFYSPRRRPQQHVHHYHYESERRRVVVHERRIHSEGSSRRGMKRSAEREMGTPLKRARNLGHELRILIPSRNAGSIIGKGGSNISRLRTENKASISVPDCPGPERLITIAADEQDVTFSVLSEIVPLLEEAGSKGERGGRGGGTGSGGGGSSGSAAGSDTGAGGAEVRMLLHHSQVGCVIGKGGGKIKELRESSGAQIKVYGSCCPRSTDRVVAICGTSEVVINAMKQIVALASDSPIKGMNEQYDPHNYDELYAAQYGGFGEARGGYGGGDRGYRSMGGDRGGDRSGGRSGPPRGSRYRNGGGGDRGDGGGGSSRGRDGRGSGGGRHRSGGSNGVGGGRQENYDDYGGDAERTTNQVTIPKEYAGAIIGKGGSRIRRIRADSGASITIDEALPGATDRIITISGAPGQIRMAQYLLQQSVKDHGELKEH